MEKKKTKKAKSKKIWTPGWTILVSIAIVFGTFALVYTVLGFVYIYFS